MNLMAGELRLDFGATVELSGPGWASGDGTGEPPRAAWGGWAVCNVWRRIMPGERGSVVVFQLATDD
jgi:hypothetical protein